MDKSTEIRNLGYELNRCLGSNEIAARETYLATQISTSHLVVIKLFNFNAGGSWQGIKDIDREIKFLQNLSHQNIPKFVEKLDLVNSFGLVMEYFDAPNLEDRQLNYEEIQHIAERVLSMLKYLQFFQPPIIHRDIKPSNILFNKETKEVYLIDFGIARTQVLTQTMTSSGTFGFTPLEGFLGQDLNKSSDLYSFGMTLICLLTNTKSYDISELFNDDGEIIVSQLLSSLNPEFVSWLSKLVSLKSRYRWENAEVALNKLHQINLKSTIQPLEDDYFLSNSSNKDSKIQVLENKYKPFRPLVYLCAIAISLYVGLYTKLGLIVWVFVGIKTLIRDDRYYENRFDFIFRLPRVLVPPLAIGIVKLFLVYLLKDANLVDLIGNIDLLFLYDRITNFYLTIPIIALAFDTDNWIVEKTNLLSPEVVWKVKSVAAGTIITISIATFYTVGISATQLILIPNISLLTAGFTGGDWLINCWLRRWLQSSDRNKSIR